MFKNRTVRPQFFKGVFVNRKKRPKTTWTVSPPYLYSLVEFLDSSAWILLKICPKTGRSARDFFFGRFCVNFCSLVGLWGLFGGCPWVRFGGQGAFCVFLIDLGLLFHQRAWRFSKPTVINTRLNAIIDFYLVFMTGDLLKHHAGA